MQDIPRKEESVTEDRREQVGVLPGAHGAKQHDIGVGAKAVGQRDRSRLQPGHRGGSSLGTERIPFEVVSGDSRIRRNQAVRHGDDANPIPRVWRAREGTRVLQLAAEVQPTQKAEHLAEGNTLIP